MTLCRNTFIICIILAWSSVHAQEKEKEIEKKKTRTYERTFQFSLFPSISTNGIASGLYFNKYSFNLFGGISAGNHNAELGLITNTHFKSSTGIQLAGLANITGGNAFINLTLWEERALIHDNYEVNNHGLQVAGILNYVFNHARGIQISGGFNHTGNDFNGFQFAGIGNSTGGFSTGVHLAGAYNLSNESMAGIQISTLFNYTDGQLTGTQISLINKARWMKGKNSTPLTRAKSLQIGLINFSKEMHGTQIGLINFGGETRGKQIGLINFFQRLKSKENANAGTPIGLINLGSFGSTLRIYYNEIFAASLEYTTGNCLNCTWTPAGPVGMPLLDKNKIKNQNSLILGFDPFDQKWGFGYGFMKLLTNKFKMAPSPRNEKTMMSYGIRFLHLNKFGSFDKRFNIVTRMSFEYGKRYRSGYVFVGIALNYFVYQTYQGSENYQTKLLAVRSPDLFNLQSSAWPGYTVGIQL